MIREICNARSEKTEIQFTPESRVRRVPGREGRKKTFERAYRLGTRNSGDALADARLLNFFQLPARCSFGGVQCKQRSGLLKFRASEWVCAIGCARGAVAVNAYWFREIIFSAHPSLSSSTSPFPGEYSRVVGGRMLERREGGTDVRFITLIAAVTKLPLDLHTIAFEIRRPRARRWSPTLPRVSQKYSANAEKRMNSFNSPRHRSANLYAAAFSRATTITILPRNPPTIAIIGQTYSAARMCREIAPS